MPGFAVFVWTDAGASGQVHLHQEGAVGGEFLQAVLEQFHRFHRIHIRQDAAELVNQFHFLGFEQQFFAAGAGSIDVDGRPDAFVDQAAVQVQFGDAGARDLFEDDLVHVGAGDNQGGGENGKAAAFFNFAGRTEEALVLLQ